MTPDTPNQTKPITEETARHLADLLEKVPKETAVKSINIAKNPVLHLRSNHIAAGVVGTTGLVMFAFGVENLVSKIPSLSSPLVEILLGLALLLVSGLFIKKLS